MNKIYPSHEKIKCKKPGCNKEIRKDRMADHLAKKHNDTSGLLVGQQNLPGFFQQKSKEVENIEPERRQFNVQQLSNIPENGVKEGLLQGAKRLELQKEKSKEIKKGAQRLELQEQEGAKSLELQREESDAKSVELKKSVDVESQESEVCYSFTTHEV